MICNYFANPLILNSCLLHWNIGYLLHYSLIYTHSPMTKPYRAIEYSFSHVDHTALQINTMWLGQWHILLFH